MTMKINFTQTPTLVKKTNEILKNKKWVADNTVGFGWANTVAESIELEAKNWVRFGWSIIERTDDYIIICK